MPLNFARALLSTSFSVAAAAEVIRAKKGVVAIGNAQISTAQSKFGGSSALFDGTGDYLQMSNSNTPDLSKDFTIECWIRFNQTTTTQKIIDTRNTGNSLSNHLVIQASNTSWQMYVDGSNRVSVSNTISNNVWYHMAAVRSGSNYQFYVNGVSVANYNASLILDFTQNFDWYIGNSKTSTGQTLYSYVDELRISNTARYTDNFTPATEPFVNDDNTLLLLHMDGTNASTYFEDDNGVRAKKGVVAIGNAQISTAQSKFGGSSALFDGTGDYLTTTSYTDYSVGTGDFTLEAWVYVSSSSANQVIACSRSGIGAGSPSANAMIIYTGKLAWSNGSAWQLTTSSFPINQWVHCAVSRLNGVVKIFLNGTQEYSQTQTVDLNGTRVFSVGAFETAATYINGYIDEVRFSNVARYTANFIPPTTPFVNDANTLLLLHMDGTNASTYFEDDNGITGRNITAYGNAQISTAQSKFGGSSALFDGTGDYLDVGKPIIPESDDWTIECWFRVPSTSTTRSIFGQYTSGVNGRFAVYIDASTDKVVVLCNHSTLGNISITSTTAVLNDTWYNLALTRSGSTVSLYINGASEGTSTISNFIVQQSANFIVGSGAYSQYTGYIDELRISNTARYTANFTPSTSPFVNDANTLLLLHMNGTNASTAFIDSASRLKKGIQAAGSIQIATTQSKFGGSSAYWNNTNGYLIIPSTSALDLSGDFTFETWVYALTSDGNYRAIWDTRDTSGSVLADEILIDMQSGGWRVYIDGSDRSPDTLSSNTWYHIALVRNGTNFKWFIDGIEKFSYTSASVKNLTVNYDMWIGNKKSQPTNYWYGYMDELRVSNTARYTSDFTPNTSPFVNDANTLLLLHMDGTNASTIFLDDNGVIPYTP